MIRTEISLPYHLISYSNFFYHHRVVMIKYNVCKAYSKCLACCRGKKLLPIIIAVFLEVNTIPA